MLLSSLSYFSLYLAPRSKIEYLNLKGLIRFEIKLYITNYNKALLFTVFAAYFYIIFHIHLFLNINEKLGN